MVIFPLKNNFAFIDPHLGDEDGLFVEGGELSVENLLQAYSKGYFPYYDFRREEPLWCCPLDRFVIFPNEIHISHSMKQLMHQNKYHVTINQDFEGVIRSCATVDGRIQEDGAWLGPDIIRAYTELHHRGYASSVEVWKPQAAGCELVGGLYGVTLNNAFFGESMFSLVPSASKLALIHLAQTMQNTDGLFIDCQFETPHLLSMGGRHITYERYMEILYWLEVHPI